MNQPLRDSNAWIFQTWAAFALSISMTTVGIVNLPVNSWVRNCNLIPTHLYPLLLKIG
jgi:hypothetical protein